MEKSIISKASEMVIWNFELEVLPQSLKGKLIDENDCEICWLVDRRVEEQPEFSSENFF